MDPRESAPALASKAAVDGRRLAHGAHRVGGGIRFWEWQREAFPRAIKTFFSQGDPERRAATGQVRRDPLTDNGR